MQNTEVKTIKILGISGSPRNMATDFIVREALKIAEEKYGAETKYFSSKGKKLNFCIHCDSCIRTKEGCIHKDDISAELYDKMIWADAWVFRATPSPLSFWVDLPFTALVPALWSLQRAVILSTVFISPWSCLL